MSYDSDPDMLEFTDCESVNHDHAENDPLEESVKPWAAEKETIKRFLRRINEAETVGLRVFYIMKVYEYFQTIGPFIAKYPRIRTALISKAIELLEDPRAEPIYGLLISTIAWANTLE